MFLVYFCAGEDTAFKEWIPLSQKEKTNRSQTWFVHVQVEISYILMSLFDGHRGSVVYRNPESDKPSAAASSSRTILSPSPNSPLTSPSPPSLECKQSNSDPVLVDVTGISPYTPKDANCKGQTQSTRTSSNDPTAGIGVGVTADVSSSNVGLLGFALGVSTNNDCEEKEKTSRLENLSEMGIL